jgi:hypothetical protein
MNKLMKNISVLALFSLLLTCASAPSSPGIGSWDVGISTPLGDQTGVWTFPGDGSGIMGSDLGDQAVEGVIMDGNTISFNVDIDAQGQVLSLSFSGAVAGDTLTGVFESDFGAFDVLGIRQ